MSHGLVRVCAQGFYREFFLDFDHPNATLCLPCNPGITTDGPGAGSPALCNKVLPGHGISTVDDLSQGAPLPALPPGAEEQGLPPASLCELGFYSTDGFCVRCPSETVTRAKGSTGIEACGERLLPLTVCLSLLCCAIQLCIQPQAGSCSLATL